MAGTCCLHQLAPSNSDRTTLHQQHQQQQRQRRLELLQPAECSSSSSSSSLGQMWVGQVMTQGRC
jgi:hypothetical protein